MLSYYENQEMLNLQIIWALKRSKPSGLFMSKLFWVQHNSRQNMTISTDPSTRPVSHSSCLATGEEQDTHDCFTLSLILIWVLLFIFALIPLLTEKEDEWDRTRHGRSVPGEEACQESSRSSRFVFPFTSLSLSFDLYLRNRTFLLESCYRGFLIFTYVRSLYTRTCSL